MGEVPGLWPAATEVMINLPKACRRRISLDIGSFSIKAVVLEKPLWPAGKPTLAYAIEYLSEAAGPAEIPGLIQKALQKIGISPPLEVSISLSGPEVIFRYLYFPLLSREKILESLRLEWDKYVSLKLDEVVWDFQLLGTTADFLKGKQRLILLVAVKKDFFEQQIRLLKEAGLILRAADTNVSGLVNTFNFIYPIQSKNRLVGLIHLGEQVSNFTILKDNLPLFSRDILFGGRDVTYLIAQKKRLTFSQARKAKHDFNGSDEEISLAIKSGVNNLINEIALTCEYLKRELKSQISSIYLSGGLAHLYGIEGWLGQGLGIPVAGWKAGAAFGLGPKNSREDLENNFAELVVALSLALV